MKKYKIPVTWEVAGVLEIEAKSLHEATEAAHHSSKILPEGRHTAVSITVENDLIEDEEGD